MQEGNRLLTIDNLLAIVVATLSALAAFAAFQSAKIDSTSTDNYFLSQALLADSNTALTDASLDVMRDFRLTDEAESFGVDDPELQERLLALISVEADNSFERSGEYFDDGYFEETYALADELFAEHDALFESAAYDSDRAVSYQLTVLIMALALSFSAWASLADAGSRMRYIFLAMSLVAMVIGLLQMLTIAPAL